MFGLCQINIYIFKRRLRDILEAAALVPSEGLIRRSDMGFDVWNTYRLAD